MALTVRYEWRHLEGGHFEKPRPEGPYYSEEELNEYGGFESREAAIAALEAWTEKHNCHGEYILVEFFRRPY